MKDLKLPSHQSFQFSDEDFRSVARCAKAIFGLHLETSKKALIQARLAKRLRATGAQSVSDYCAMVQSERTREKDPFISALTTNVTHFFRERHHFDYLEKQVLPGLLSEARKGRRVRIWSAGCSTGQEAYSIAGTLLSMSPDVLRQDIQILATDVDPAALETARRGVYASDECRFDDPADIRKVFASFDRASSQNHVKAELKTMITFQRLNLMEHWSHQGSFDVIFCRNVAIYFDRPDQSRLWMRFVERLTEGGSLIIGHSERIHGPAENILDAVAVTTYRKATASAQPTKFNNQG
ncbi:CheR family methyltransferase [Aestuariivita boseongensis]|uniref:CheR family methyltransferase n=1 Tax=Aestuariivita boseongensis TaxID=1470562 RepID=UPI0006814BF5|nr:protein-glutamate O-methyltransferase CheR [Aestuariivita boseongensis]